MNTSDPEHSVNITERLRVWNDGDRAAVDEMLPLVYNELRRRASRYLRRERSGHTLQTTALVHEAYLKLAGQDGVEWKNRGHFFAVAAQAMRRILVDHARTRHRDKRGGRDEDLPLEDVVLAIADEQGVDVAALDEALSRLARHDPRQETIVEMRYFAGLSIEETAEALGISKATVAREWQLARAWLYRELTR
jgi:RNA polymerase sigma-70 factor, ECF subfamily